MRPSNPVMDLRRIYHAFSLFCTATCCVEVLTDNLLIETTITPSEVLGGYDFILICSLQSW